MFLPGTWANFSPDPPVLVNNYTIIQSHGHFPNPTSLSSKELGRPYQGGRGTTTVVVLVPAQPLLPLSEAILVGAPSWTHHCPTQKAPEDSQNSSGYWQWILLTPGNEGCQSLINLLTSMATFCFQPL